MKVKSKKILITSIIVSLIIITGLFALVSTTVNKKTSKYNAELLRAMSYEELKPNSMKIENCDYVQFGAFFARDLDGDGIAEKLLGSCKNIKDTDQLYIDLNVLSKGYLKDGVITINGTNFNYSMNMVKDSVLKNTYISEDVEEIELNQVNAGTQKLIIGNILPDLQNNINNYSNISSITLEGTYVAEDGTTETKISKTIDVTVDWYGSVEADLYENYEATTFYYNYKEVDSTIGFEFRIDELKKELLLKENVVKATIPELNGYAPTKVECKNGNVEAEYDEQTRVITIKRNSVLTEDEENTAGQVINTLASSNTYNIEVTYPQEAYDTILSYEEIKVPVEGYYVGYNNNNEEFENPCISNVETGNLTLVFRDIPEGKIYDFEVEFMDKSAVTRPDHKYVISKQDIINMYDENKAIANKKYEVRWIAKRGPVGEVTATTMSETKEAESYGDKWNDTIMTEYVSNIGIYFQNANEALGEDGLISVYDNDTNELIEVFDKQEWNKYTKTNPYKYANEVKHIRIETTSLEQNTILMIYNIKEMDMEKILNDFTKEDIQDVETVYTYLTATCDIKDQEPGEVKDIDYATYVSDKSYASINLRQNELETQATYTNTITINTQASQVGDAKWLNGIFLVEIPEEIISMEIKDVSINDAKVKIVGYDLYKENGKYFIKVITENEEEETYKITINCTMTTDPRTPSLDREVKLYAYNENCNDYYYETIDTFDVDGDTITQEKIGISKEQLRLLSPTSLITLETITNYNDKGEITVAPNVADVAKDRNTATVNIELTNNYPNTIGAIKTLGKIPFEGNTYVLNKETLKSEFSTTITKEGVQVPEELEGKVVVYYSAKENPTQDIQKPENGWTLLENVDDFSKIKTYLIDLKDSEIKVGETYTFSYNVNIPDGLDYNKVTYSDHAVFFELKTDNGNIQLSTEPNKVGIRIARTYNLEIVKYKEDTTLGVPSCIYKLVELDEKGKEISSKLLTTNANGKMTASGIYVDKTYKLQELKSSKQYSLNKDEIEFRVVEENGNLKFEKISGEDFASEVVVEKNESGEDVVKSTVENKPRYSIKINKIDETTKEALRDVYFRVEEIGRTYITDDNGYVTIENLEQDIEYTLVETKAEGYYLPEKFTFKLVKNEGKLTVESNIANLKQAVIENSDTEHVIKVEANITNEKIPTFNLQVLKVEKIEDETQELKTLQGAEFKLTSKDTEKEEIYVTDENGSINISDLYIYKEGKDITGEYTLTEIKAPQGYVNNAEEIKFKISKDDNNNLVVNVLNADNVKTLNKTEVNENTVKFIIEDKPLFRLVKVDEATGEKLEGVEFIVYELNEDGTILDFAKDTNGEYVGNKNDKNQYIVTTDNKGRIELPLKYGKYKAIEVKQLEGYEEIDGSYLFDVSENLSASENPIKESDLNIEIDTNVVLEIKTAEDLKEFANRVNNGESFDGQAVVLANTIDMENQEFTPIGTSTNAFMGTFDGQGHEIRNINVENVETAGLFGCTYNAVIKNVGVTGNVQGKNYVGGIVGQSTGSAILNSYSKVNLTVEETTSTHYVGGIVGEQLENSIVYNCYNEGTISTDNIKVNGYIGGLVGTSTSSKVISSYNKGEISLKGYLDIELGGILGKSNSSEVTNCFNEADINIERLEGGNGSYYVGGIVGNGGTILSSYNTGKITNNAKRENSYIYLGGIAGSSNKVENSYNKGEINSGVECSCYVYISGITNSFGSAIITNCYNTADIYNYAEGNSTCYTAVNGIGQGTINKCFNAGDIFNTAISNNASTTAYVSGIGQNSTVSNSYNSGYILNMAKDYAYGTTSSVAGIGYNATVVNCYNAGNVINDTKSYGYYPDYVTAMASPLSDTENVTNSYYLDSITISGTTVSEIGTKVTDEELKSEGKYNEINTDNAWLRYEEVYPRLSPMSQVDIVSGIELNIKNTKKAYKITTSVNGTGGKITGENEQPFEIVEHGKDATKEIKVEPDDEFLIEKITINGKEIEFTVAEDGSYIIPAEEFKTMQEDKHVVVEFRGIINFTINKVDEETQEPIQNAKFAIYSVDANGEIIDFAKDINEAYIGEQNDEEIYVVSTDENGQIILMLPQGLYKAVEIEAAEGYKLEENEEDRTYYFGIEKSQKQEISSEGYSLDWAKTIKSELDAVYESVIPTEDGGVIAVGTTFGNTALDGEGYPDVFGNGNEEGIIVKYAENGKVEWTKLLTGINSEKLYSIAKDPNGGYVIAGSTSSTEVYLDTAKIGTKYSGNEDGIILKIDDDGRYLWCQSIGGTGIDRVNSVAISEYGEIAVTGSYTSTEITVDKQATESLTNVGAANKCKNAFIVVYSNDGEYLWSQNVGADKDTTGASIVATNNGFAVAVNFMGTVYLNTEKSVSASSWGQTDGIVISYDNYGELLWYKKLSSSQNVSVKQVTTDKDGNIIVVGAGAGQTELVGDDSAWIFSKGLFDGIIVKYTEDGEYVTARPIAGTQDEVISSVAVTEDGGLLLGGWTYSTAVDLNNDEKNEISENLGNSDAIIMKLDSKFKLEWYDTIKGEGFDSIKGVVETSKNNYIAIGDFNSSNATVDNTEKALKAVRLSDAFIVKYGCEVLKPEIKQLEELNIKNSIKTYRITTEIAENSHNRRIGGTTNGTNNVDYDYLKIIERVAVGNNSTQEIIIMPNDGYALSHISINGEKIPFTPGENGGVVLSAEYFKNVTEDKHIVVTFEPNTNFVITKVDKDTNEPIADTKFAIYKVDSYGNKLGFAKDVNNEYIGEKNDDKIYVIPTDENGKISLALPEGYYKAVEIESAEGYALPKDEKERTTYFKVKGKNGDSTEEQADFVITHIEDLVDLSNRVNAGETFEGKIVVLANTIDFEDSASYRNPEDTETYGDYNEDGTVASIKEELTTGSGFKSIGTSDNSFMGIFDGKGNVIKNINARHTACGLFGVVKSGEILNLGIVEGRTTAGGIAFSISNSKVINCYNSSYVEGNYLHGGIVCYVHNNSQVINCYNSGKIGQYAAGIAFSATSNELIDTYYLNTTASTGIFDKEDINGSTESIAQEQMQSQEFVDLLNSNRTSIETDIRLVGWKYNEGSYPTFAVNEKIDFIEDGKVTITNTLKDFTTIINKVDEETKEPIPNTKFVIYSVTASGTIIDFAKDKDGKYIGKLNENGEYEVSTNKNGQLRLELPGGLYKAVEVEAAEGYALELRPEDRTTYFNVETVVISHVEDLVNLSKRVNEGETFEGKTVILANTIDFEDTESYRNAEDTETYGDYNGDGIVQTIKEELTAATKTSGLKPIGNDNNPFKGKFDGKGFEINNISIAEGDSYIGLFGRVDLGEIKNLGITRKRFYNSSYTGTKGSGGIIGNLVNGKVLNCYNVSTDSAHGGLNYEGGIVCKATNSIIADCYNSQHLVGINESGGAGGIASQISRSKLVNCREYVEKFV